jgi:hypothetical protein
VTLCMRARARMSERASGCRCGAGATKENRRD